MVVYRILNKVNGLFYIGSTNNPIRRECEHFFELENGTHHNYKLQKDYRNYGKKSFEFQVIKSDFNLKSEAMLFEYSLIIETFDNNYNIDKEYPLPNLGKKKISKKKFYTKKVKNTVEANSSNKKHIIDPYLISDERKRILNNINSSKKY